MKFSTTLGYVVVALLVLVSLLCFIAPESNPLLAGKNHTLLGGIFLAYAVFRFYRVRSMSQRNSTSNTHTPTNEN